MRIIYVTNCCDSLLISRQELRNQSAQVADQEEDQREALEADFEAAVGERLEVGEGLEIEVVEEVGADLEEEAAAASARVEVEEGGEIPISQDLEHIEVVVHSRKSWSRGVQKSHFSQIKTFPRNLTTESQLFIIILK